MIIGTVSSLQLDALAVSKLSPIRYSPFNPSAERESNGPWLKPAYNPYEQTVRQAATGIANFLQSVQDVQLSATALLHKDSSSIQARTADSSAPDIITANAGKSATLASYRVQVDSVATSQSNSGIALNASGASAIQSGTNQLSITIGGKTTTITSLHSSTGTNEQELARLSKAINAARTGVNASVVSDKKAGTVKLELTGAKTGSDQMFEVKDVSGNAAAATGIANMTSAAMNASFRVNGGPAQVSQSNEISLEKGKVTATLNSHTVNAVEIRVDPDHVQLISQVKKIVANFNKMHNRLEEAGGYISVSVRKQLNNAVSSPSYEQVGIHKKSDGSLALDEDKLKRSLIEHNEQTSRILTGSRGFASSVKQATERFNDAAASSLINHKLQEVQQLAVYQSSMQAALQMPKTGLLLNQFV